jgi:hypothetical protein
VGRADAVAARMAERTAEFYKSQIARIHNLLTGGDRRAEAASGRIRGRAAEAERFERARREVTDLTGGDRRDKNRGGVMRYGMTLLIMALLSYRPAAADDDLADKLVGSWRIVSQKVQVVGEPTERDIMGAHPVGRIVFSADRHFCAFFVPQRSESPAKRH